MKHKKRPNRKFIITLSIIFCFTSIFSIAQTSIADVQTKQFSAAEPVTFKEKIYVHTDKSFYMPGEIIWFKIYCLDAGTNTLADISKVAYAEISDKQNKRILQAKVAMEHGTGNGSFMIPSTIGTANYSFRAYTNWMNNFSADDYFQKQITIVNASKRPDWQSLQKAEATDVQFFPEGGDLVYGIESKVAFRAVNQNGKGIDFNGYILNQKSDTISRFKPFRFGIGSFYFTAEKGNDYTAILRLQNGKVINTALPPIRDFGYVCQLKDADKEHIIVIVKNNSNRERVDNYLTVGNSQKILAAFTGKSNNGQSEFIVDKNRLTAGISTFTIFNSAREPVCERLYFKKPEIKTLIDITTAEAEYGIRAKVNVELMMHDKTNIQLPADLSMSVYLLDSLQKTDESDISSYLWLSSELKGTIESPNYYLSNEGIEVDEATDNLMLTHGWRRFINPENEDRKQPTEFVPEYEGHIVKATLLNKQTGKPAQNIVTYLSVPNEKFWVSNGVSNKNGDVYFVIKNFYGSSQIIVQTNNQIDSNYTISVSDPFSDKYSQMTSTAFELSEKWKNQLMSRYVSSQIQNAFSSANPNKFTIPQTFDSTAFYGMPDKKYFLDDYTRFPTMEEVLHEYVSEVLLRKQGQNFHISVRNAPYSSNFKEDPFVLLDGVPVFNMNKIVSFDPLKIKKLEVISKKYYFNNVINSGILSYYTYGGDLAGFELDPNSVVLEFDGLQIKREFFSPVYDNAEKVKSPVADVRNVLYWSPDVLINNNEKKKVSFYTSDLPGNYAIVIQGINKDGLPVSSIKTISIKK